MTMTVQHKATGVDLALSVRQPWALLLLTGRKSIECRDWHPGRHMVGTEFWLHASGKVDQAALSHFGGREGLLDDPVVNALPSGLDPLATGAIIGRLRLVDVHHYAGPQSFHKHDNFHLCKGDLWQPSAFGWEMRLVQALPQAVPCKGMLKFFRLPDSIMDEIRRETEWCA